MLESVTFLKTRRFQLVSADPAFMVTRQSASRFLLSGTVSDEPVTDLHVETPSERFAVPLATRSGPRHAVEQLQRLLPSDVLMHTVPRPTGVEVSLVEAVIPAARAPRVRVFSTDLVQRIHQLEDNRVELRGAIGADAHLTLSCDSRRVTIAVNEGLSASATAVRLAAAVPHGYRALADGATITVWKDADFFSMVA